MKSLIILFLTLLVNLSLIAQENTLGKYYMDRLHSSVTFSVDYLEIMDFDGRADDYFGVIITDEDENIVSLEFIVKARSLNTSMINRDADLHSTRYLDVNKYPEITYKSDSFFTRNDTLFSQGILRIKESSKNIEIPYSKIVSEENSTRKLIVIKTAPMIIKRQEFGIGTIERTSMDKIFLGEEIRITIKGLFKSLRPREIELFNQNPKIKISQNELDKFIGTYSDENGVLYNVEKYENKLFFVLADAAVFRALFPISNNSFIVSDVGYTIIFNVKNTGVESLTYKRGGENNSERWQTMKKIK